jgi:hypothetical protein
MSGVSNNPQGIVVPASALQQGNIAMTTVNSQVVSGRCREWGAGDWGEHPGRRKGGLGEFQSQGYPPPMEGLPVQFLN